MDRKVIFSIVGTFSFAAIGGIASHFIMKDKETKLPVVYSDLEQYKPIFAEKTQIIQISPATSYYARAHDIPMSIFDASNTALANGDDHKYFADELSKRFDYNQHGAEAITENLDSISEDARIMLRDLEYLQKRQMIMAP